VPDTDYTVRLPAFEGPLDLLLHLIERRELDITAISLGAVTDQYLEYVERLEEVEPSTLAEFLTVAAQLMLIKSRLLLPQPEPEDMPEEEDPAEALARRLEEYRQFKQVAAGLRDRETKGLRAYKRGGPLPEFPTRPLLEGIAPADLAQTLQTLLSQRPKVASVNRVIRPLRVTVAEKIELLGKILAKRKRIHFHQLLRRTSTRQEVIATFLAMLEMIKRQHLVVRQEHLFGEIMIELAPDPTSTPANEEDANQDS